MRVTGAASRLDLRRGLCGLHDGNVGRLELFDYIDNQMSQGEARMIIPLYQGYVTLL